MRARDSTVAAASPGKNFSFDTASCDALADRRVAYAFAAQEINGFATDELDTASMFAMRGHFTSADSEQVLVYMPYHPNGSCGTCCHVLMIFGCEGKARLITSEQEGGFTRKDIRDLDGDGVHEIETRCATAWMGEYRERYTIINFAGGKMNELYRGDTYSLLGSGLGDAGIAQRKKAIRWARITRLNCSMKIKTAYSRCGKCASSTFATAEKPKTKRRIE